MGKTTFCLSSLDGQIKAGALQKGAVARTWEGGAGIDDAPGIAAAIKEAVQKIQPAGKQVAMVLAHPRLSHHVVEIPPVKGWKLDQFLQRRATSLKAFEGEVTWSRQAALRTKNADARLMHLLPKPALDQWVRACEAAELQLVRVIPAAAVLASQLKQLPLEKDEVTLLAGETGISTTVVIGRRDGQPGLSRVFWSGWGLQLEATAVELTRTIGFAEQQSGLTVTSVWVFGPGAKERLPDLQRLLKIPVKLSPVEWTPFYWAEQAAKLPEKDDGNLISPELQQAPQRRRFLTATTIFLLLLLLLAIGAAGLLEMLRRGQLQSLETLKAEVTRQQARKADWDKRYAVLAHQKEIVRMVTQEKPPPVPGWFLGYLGDAMPDELVVTDLRVTRTNNLWAVHLAGAVQVTNNTPENVLAGYRVLTNALVSGPFHFEITRSALDERGPNAPRRTATVPATGAAAVVPETNHQFLLEGVMR